MADVRVGLTLRELTAWTRALREDRRSRQRVAYEIDQAVVAAIKAGITVPRSSSLGEGEAAE